jgi:uncharacterized protein (DUF486 family)
MTWLPPAIRPIFLLLISNFFMTFAWYGHLKFTERPLWLVVVASWSIAFIEYCFAVPANRWGHVVYSAAELKTMQEVITLSVFAAFSVFYLGERITLNHLVGFAFICAGAFFVFRGPLPSW